MKKIFVVFDDERDSSPHHVVSQQSEAMPNGDRVQELVLDQSCPEVSDDIEGVW